MILLQLFPKLTKNFIHHNIKELFSFLLWYEGYRFSLISR